MIKPVSIVISACLTGWMGIDVTLNQLGSTVLSVVPFIALGCWILVKYTINVIRLRHYLEDLAKGSLPDRVVLVTDEDDLAAIRM